MLKFCVLLLNVLIAFDCLCQDSTASFDNNFILPNYPFLLNRNNRLDLPIEAASLLTIEGISKSRTYVVLDSVRSKSRIKKSVVINLVVKPGQITAETNPFASYRLFSLTVNQRKNTRQYLSFTQRSGLINASTEYNPGLPVKIKKEGNDIYILMLENLKPGEYALIIAGSLYSFGID